MCSVQFLILNWAKDAYFPEPRDITGKGWQRGKHLPSFLISQTVVEEGGLHPEVMLSFTSLRISSLCHFQLAVSPTLKFTFDDTNWMKASVSASLMKPRLHVSPSRLILSLDTLSNPCSVADASAAQVSTSLRLLQKLLGDPGLLLGLRLQPFGGFGFVPHLRSLYTLCAASSFSSCISVHY